MSSDAVPSSAGPNSAVPPTLDVEYEITLLLRRSRNRGLRTVGELHPELDFGNYLLLLTIHDARLAGKDGVRATDLAETFEVHKSTVSRGLASLERLGLIERIPDPTDGRARLVALSADAVARLTRVRTLRHEQLAAVLDEWAPEDLNTFARLLARLNTAFE